MCVKIFATTALALSAIISACAASTEIAQSDRPVPQFHGCPDSKPILAAADSDFGRDLIVELKSRIFYPEPSLATGQAGHVDLCVDMARDGTIIRSLVEVSSRYPLLDGAALYSLGIAKANNRPRPVPDEIGAGAPDVWFSVPVDFTLKEGEAEPAPPAINFLDNPSTNEQKALLKDYLNSPAWTDYTSRFVSAFEETLVYPPYALRKAEVGRVLMQVVMRRDGQILGARISSSAGDPQFDGIALMTIGLMALKPDKFPLPDNILDAGGTLVLNAPISFQL